uniref:Structural glycoprotein n=1 Tax=Lactate dehydrogenase-elevating virus TaxID=11048 RepID=Q06499_LDV|nr:structural glycoprotein [Lactate dehydrogenase-elevating virus]WKR37862.1 GP3 [Lactate dehydrogenase-elevating virus]
MASFNAIICVFICFSCCCIVDCNVTAPTKTCLWFPIHETGKTHLELSLNFTLCKMCGVVENSYYSHPFCVTDDTCEESSSQYLDFDFPDDVQLLTSIYGTIAINALVFAIHQVPEMFGNVTAIHFSENTLCYNSTPIEHGKNVTTSLAIFDGDVSKWYVLEYIRPLFSSWLVLNVSYFLRRSTAGRATRRL